MGEISQIGLFQHSNRGNFMNCLEYIDSDKCISRLSMVDRGYHMWSTLTTSGPPVLFTCTCNKW